MTSLAEPHSPSQANGPSLVVRTSPSHGENTGSSPVGVTNRKRRQSTGFGQGAAVTNL